MNPELEETIYVDFVTSSPTTGAAVDADSTPTAEVFEDASDTAIVTPTVTKRVGKTGNYRVPVACTAANGFEAGKSYNVVASATVGTVVAKAVVQTFQMRTNGADDLAANFVGVNTKLDTIDDFLDTEVAAIKTKTDQLVFTVAGRVDATAQSFTISGADLTAIADAILKRDFSAVSGEAARSTLNALRFLRNKFSVSGTTLTVTKEDDATPAWLSTLTTDAAAQPIVASDPA